MKVNYTGKLDQLSPSQQKKLDAKFSKLARLLDRKSEKEAHVILTAERHLHRAEITVNFYDHPLVAVEAAPDHFTALTNALDKLEKQILKLRAKWRDTRRVASASVKVAAPAPVEAAAKPASKSKRAAKPVVATKTRTRVFRVDEASERKPMTLDEALLEMEGSNGDYVVYQDSSTERLSVLVRRRDGNFDLIEG